jgi:hypothetical protein
VAIPVTDVKLSPPTLTVLEGESKHLTAVVEPDNATDPAVIWTPGKTGDTGAVTVDAGGWVTGVTAGTATVTVSVNTAGGPVTRECTVTVVKPEEGGVDSWGIDSREKWLAALADVTAAADGAGADDPHVFEFNITGDFSVEGTTAASISGSRKEVRLVGIKTISLDPTGPKGSLIRTAANQRFVIDGPTLQGRPDNDAVIVYITGSNSAVELRGGEIKGNTSTNVNSYGKGGVYVYGSGATFTMSGGTISGNTAVTGGGVYAESGTFTMSGGTISGNMAVTGGGVYVSRSGGTFTMSGGTISGNTADMGGGVDVFDSGATFTMIGGTISGNTVSYGSGGGVDVSFRGTFTMSGGTISGNTASYGSGGGVYAGANSTFTMSGGTISGNTAMDGGGVYIYHFDNADNETFTKTGGIIYGDTDNIVGNGYATDNTATRNTTDPDYIGKNGHAVRLQRYITPNYDSYYRNETLTGADSISTADLTTNWTQRP